MVRRCDPPQVVRCMPPGHRQRDLPLPDRRLVLRGGIPGHGKKVISVPGAAVAVGVKQMRVEPRRVPGSRSASPCASQASPE